MWIIDLGVPSPTRRTRIRGFIPILETLITESMTTFEGGSMFHNVKTYWTRNYFLKLGFLFSPQIKVSRNIIIVNFMGGVWWRRLETFYHLSKKTKHDIEFVII